MLTLRPYQEAALAALDTYFTRAKGNPLIVAPTGSGKSILIAEFCRRAMAWPDTRILMLTHVRELIAQNAAELQALWPEAPLGIYSAGLGLRQVRPITFGGIQSVYDQAHKLGPVDLVLIDEAHLVPASGEGMYRTLLGDLLKMNPATKAIGFTATPFRTDSGKLTDPGGIFTDVAFDIDLLQLIREGHLCRLVSKGVKTEAEIDTKGVKIVAGEFNQGQLEARALDVVDAAIVELMRLGAQRKHWLIFCSGVDHGFDVAARLSDLGVEARMIEGATPKDQRDEITRDFKAGNLRALVNANVLTTGFNAPATDLIVLLRATCSPGLLVQMCGRGMRNAEGKTDCLVLDFGGNFERHGPINAIRPRRRMATGEMASFEPLAPRLCFVCGLQEVVRADLCAGCGQPWPKAEPRAPSHGTKASDAPAIAEPEDVQVKRVAYAPHVKPGKTTSMCVSYHTDQGWIDEWICLEHAGYAREKAVQWWLRRSPSTNKFLLDSVPSTVAAAIERISELLIPRALKVQREGGFWRVKGYFWHADPAAELAAREESLKVQRLRDAERAARLPLSPLSDEGIPF